MTIDEALENVARLFLDTAPVIYYVEGNPDYLAAVESVFERLDAGTLSAVTSPVTLAECLVAPYRLGAAPLQQAFWDLIVGGTNTTFVTLDGECARQAADLRARYNLTLADAFQFAVALRAGCEAFLTNDAALQRVTGIRVVVLAELDLSRSEIPAPGAVSPPDAGNASNSLPKSGEDNGE